MRQSVHADNVQFYLHAMISRENRAVRLRFIPVCNATFVSRRCRAANRADNLLQGFYLHDAVVNIACNALE